MPSAAIFAIGVKSTSHYRRGTAVGHGSMYLMRLGVQGPVQVTPARC